MQWVTVEETHDCCLNFKYEIGRRIERRGSSRTHLQLLSVSWGLSRSLTDEIRLTQYMYNGCLSDGGGDVIL